jgi:cytoskeletal protein RodZ
MKRLSAAFALTTLAAATLALAQPAQTPDTTAPPSDTQSQMQSQPSDQSSSADQSSSTQSTDQSTTQGGGTADKETLMKTCMSQVQASNPNVSQKDIKDFCDREVNRSASSPQ